MNKKYTLQKVLGIIVAVVIVLLIVKCSVDGGQSGTFQADSSHEASIVHFLDSHPELRMGSMKFPYVEEVADWAEGKRMRVFTDSGSYLVYFVDTDIVTVYLETQDGKRIEIFNTHIAG